MSLFVVYFGTRRRHTQLAHHDILFGPRYEELLHDIFNGPGLADDFSLYLHAPTLTDPSVAPDGCEAFYVLSPVPHLGKAKIDWEVEGPRYRDRILEYLEKRYIPNLREDLVTTRILTPLDFQQVLNSHHGSAFSLEPILTQSAFFRVHNRDDRIGGLYFAGAGTHPGAGVPGVVNSAKATAGLMLSRPRAWRPADRRTVDPLVARSQAAIERGSKSFAAAARLFAPATREGAFLLYAWCRHCDDEIDEQVLGFRTDAPLGGLAGGEARRPGSGDPPRPGRRARRGAGLCRAAGGRPAPPTFPRGTPSSTSRASPWTSRGGASRPSTTAAGTATTWPGSWG